MLSNKTRFITDYHMLMKIEDTYALSNIVALLYPKGNFNALHDASKWTATRCIQYLTFSLSKSFRYVRPTVCSYGNEFQYSIKELLAYLYDKIESN
jgi:hypothetical protein